VVPTPGTVYHKLVTGYDDPTSEPSSVLARAVVLLATEPLDKVTGRVGYSQQLLKEFGWADDGTGPGIDPGAKVSGYAAS
jgi:citronellol/citronellal dehydrogenase